MLVHSVATSHRPLLIHLSLQDFPVVASAFKSPREETRNKTVNKTLKEGGPIAQLIHLRDL